jgi:DNA (cytosine-5)-methyltransferase 1
VWSKNGGMKVLNLFAGIGGNRKHWDADVTAVELNPQIAEVYKQNFPNDTVIVGDAHKYLHEHYDEFDFIWSSPPCQSHSRMVKATRHKVTKYPDMMLYQEIILLKEFFKGKWVVENVMPYYEPLMNPVKIGRHLFWSNFYIGQFNEPRMKDFINTDDPEKFKEWLGIHYEGNIYYGENHSPSQVLRNAVHPELGKHVFNCSQSNALFV